MGRYPHVGDRRRIIPRTVVCHRSPAVHVTPRLLRVSFEPASPLAKPPSRKRDLISATQKRQNSLPDPHTHIYDPHIY